jgi:regulator of RNase E activity RraA
MSGGRPAPLTPARIAELQPILRAALVADALDAVGLRGACLDGDVRALTTALAERILVGNAFTMQAVPAATIPETPYVGLLRALDAISPGDVVVIAAGGAQRVALWGELLSNACLARGGMGAVCDGPARDAASIRELGFPVFCRGTLPLDINGRAEVVEHGGSVVVDGIGVASGDLIVADSDGVVVVPLAVRDEVVARAVEKATAESGFRDAVRSGVAPSEAFARHNVL